MAKLNYDVCIRRMSLEIARLTHFHLSFLAKGVSLEDVTDELCFSLGALLSENRGLQVDGVEFVPITYFKCYDDGRTKPTVTVGLDSPHPYFQDFMPPMVELVTQRPEENEALGKNPSSAALKDMDRSPSRRCTLC